MNVRETVVIGLIGTQLDEGRGPNRWDRWRPTIDLCRHDDLVISRFDLLTQRRFRTLSNRLAEDIRMVSPETEVRLHDVPFRDPWDFEEVYGRLHDFARSYAFDPEHEDYLVNITTGTHVAQICSFLLTESHHIPGRLVQVSPPRGRGRRRDGEAAPADPGARELGSYTIIDLDLSRYDRLASRFAQEQREDLSFLKSGIETRNADFNALIERIERVAIASTAPILLTGPTGAGKSQLARRIFELKERRRQIEGPFVEVNCATLRGDQAMSALFGHVKGAFTGAAKDRSGLLRSADTGVLFLDEIGELGLDEQAMLLRAVEEKRFLPVGTDREIESDFQLIAGTNRDLTRAVADGRFREDLLARIDLWTFALPGLRDRPEDIEPNLEYELEGWARTTGTRVDFNREARREFVTFATSTQALWKGNFRELNGAIIRMATLAEGGRINESLVREEIERLTSPGTAPDSRDRGIVTEVLDDEARSALDRFDRAQLDYVVGVCRESRSLSEAGRHLYNVSRTRRTSTNDADRLRKYLQKFGLDWSAVVDR
jgi:transcriptional regulatory protein RtcR